MSIRVALTAATYGSMPFLPFLSPFAVSGELSRVAVRRLQICRPLTARRDGGRQQPDGKTWL